MNRHQARKKLRVLMQETADRLDDYQRREEERLPSQVWLYLGMLHGNMENLVIALTKRNVKTETCMSAEQYQSTVTDCVLRWVEGNPGIRPFDIKRALDVDISVTNIALRTLLLGREIHRRDKRSANDPVLADDKFWILKP